MQLLRWQELLRGASGTEGWEASVSTCRARCLNGGISSLCYWKGSLPLSFIWSYFRVSPREELFPPQVLCWSPRCSIPTLFQSQHLGGVSASPESLTDSGYKATEEQSTTWFLVLLPLLLRALVEAMKADRFCASEIGKTVAAEILKRSLYSLVEMLLS